MTIKNKNSAINTLISISKLHYKKLIWTFTLVGLENLLFLLYPLVWAFAVNAVLNWQTFDALLYALMVFVIWFVGSLRRAVDTRVFVKIYTELVVKAIINQKEKWNTSSATAHATLSRQFVDFFEEYLPTLITSIFSILWAVIMLLIIEFWSWIVALCILLLFLIILPKYTKINDKLYFDLNNNLENEVNIIEKNNYTELQKHYNLLSKIRISISNREALSYFVIGVMMAFLFWITLYILSLKNIEAGHIYAVITYLWTFAMSIDDMPRLVEKFSELKDIWERVDILEK